MLPSLYLSPPSPAAVKVDKATSELLIGPDWTINMEICDAINSDHWLAKDVVKALKKRLQHKNPRVQFLALTLLETMVKNCGDYIHFHIAEKKILDEMIKIVKKRTDMQVRDKVLVLLDSWQEAFGGPGGKHAQYYWACDELRRSGVSFPPRSSDSAPIFTPPTRDYQASFGMPINSSTRLDEAMASEVEGLSTSTMQSMQNVMELLADMLEAVNPTDRMAVKDELIVDLVERCRANQKKLMQMLTTTADEELLVQGLDLNDAMQGVLAKHDAISSGTPLLTFGTRPTAGADESAKGGVNSSKAEGKQTNESSSVPAAPTAREQVDEEEEDDEFAQLARRHLKPHPNMPTGSFEDIASSSNASSDSAPCNALALPDPPTPIKTTKEQEMIDLLSIVLSTSSASPQAPQTPEMAPPQRQVPVSSEFQDTYAPQIYSGNQVQAPFNSYVVPWAQPQVHEQFHPQPQPQLQQPGFPQYSSAYPPPPWAATSGFSHSQAPEYRNPYAYSSSQPGMNNSTPKQGVQLSQQFNSFRNPNYAAPHTQSASHTMNHLSPAPTQGVGSLQRVSSFQNQQHVDVQTFPTSQAMSSVSATAHGGKSLQNFNGVAMNGEAQAAVSSVSSASGQKPFIPSYRLFEDLNVFGNTEGKLRSGPYPSASGNSNQSMVGGRR